MKKTVIIIENILLGVAKSIVIMGAMLAAYLDDYIIPPSDIEKVMIIVIGLAIAIILDLIINFIIYKLINRKNINIRYKKMILISLIVTLIIFIYLKIMT